MTITIEIPLTPYMMLAGAAALNGVDVSTYTKKNCQHAIQPAVPAPAPEPAAAAQPALPAPAAARPSCAVPIAEPEHYAPAAPEPTVMSDAEADALLASINA